MNLSKGSSVALLGVLNPHKSYNDYWMPSSFVEG